MHLEFLLWRDGLAELLCRPLVRHARPAVRLQAVELKAVQIVHVGPCDATHYPIAKKKTSYEFLRG